MSRDDRAISREEQGQILTRHRLREAGIPARYADQDIRQWTSRSREQQAAIKTAVHLVEAWKPDSERGLLLGGMTGTGKSAIAAWMLAEIIRRSRGKITGRFMNVAWWLKEMQREMNAREEGDAFMEAVTAPVLVLDDLGASSLSGWDLEQVYLLINARYEGLLPIIATTNLPTRSTSGGTTLAQAVGERVVSRLCETCEWVTCGREDTRSS